MSMNPHQESSLNSFEFSLFSRHDSTPSRPSEKPSQRAQPANNNTNSKRNSRFFSDLARLNHLQMCTNLASREESKEGRKRSRERKNRFESLQSHSSSEKRMKKSEKNRPTRLALLGIWTEQQQRMWAEITQSCSLPPPLSTLTLTHSQPTSNNNDVRSWRSFGTRSWMKNCWDFFPFNLFPVCRLTPPSLAHRSDCKQIYIISNFGWGEFSASGSIIYIFTCLSRTSVRSALPSSLFSHDSPRIQLQEEKNRNKKWTETKSLKLSWAERKSFCWRFPRDHGDAWQSKKKKREGEMLSSARGKNVFRIVFVLARLLLTWARDQFIFSRWWLCSLSLALEKSFYFDLKDSPRANRGKAKERKKSFFFAPKKLSAVHFSFFLFLSCFSLSSSINFLPETRRDSSCAARSSHDYFSLNIFILRFARLTWMNKFIFFIFLSGRCEHSLNSTRLL